MTVLSDLTPEGNLRPSTESEHPERVDKSPAELLTGETHPHWLEMLGYQRFKRN